MPERYKTTMHIQSGGINKAAHKTTHSLDSWIKIVYTFYRLRKLRLQLQYKALEINPVC